MIRPVSAEYFRPARVGDGELAEDGFTVEAPKTKLLAGKIKGMGITDRVLIITPEVDDNLWMSSRNLANVLIVEPRYADPVSLVHYRKVLVTRAAMDKLQEMFA